MAPTTKPLRTTSSTASGDVVEPRSEPAAASPSPASSPATESMPAPKPGPLSKLAEWVRQNAWMVVSCAAIVFVLWLITTDFFPKLAGSFSE